MIQKNDTSLPIQWGACDLNQLLARVLAHALPMKTEAGTGYRRSSTMANAVMNPADKQTIREMIVYSGLWEAWARRPVHLQLDLPAGLPAVKGNEILLEQLLIVLLLQIMTSPQFDNSRLRITTSEIELPFTSPANLLNHNWLQPGRYVCLMITKAELTLKPKVQNSLFSLSSWDAHRPVAGLKLLTLLEIVEVHQGGLQVFNCPGENAIYKIFLPAVSSRSDVG